MVMWHDRQGIVGVVGNTRVSHMVAQLQVSTLILLQDGVIYTCLLFAYLLSTIL